MSTVVLNTPLSVLFEVPAGACDCHVHFYDAEVQADLGFTRVVVLQPTGYAFDI
jgi:hypothetical protein